MLLWARVIVNASWVVLLLYFVWGWWRARDGRTESGRKADSASLAGMAIEVAAMLLIPFFRVDNPALPAGVYAAAAALGAAAAALGIAAGIHLGRQLRVQAVVTDQHRLIVTGPYGVVRHPIYASLLGLTIAIALVHADWRVLLFTIPLFLLGTEIRVRIEDRLLASHFGQEFETYRRTVAAYIPGVR